MSVKKRSFKVEKLARIYDDEILPVWAQPFGRMILRDLEIDERAQILDVACNTGYPAVEIIRRKPEGARLIAIEGASALLDVARRKVEEMGGPKGVFFRTESAEPKLSFAADVYDIVVCNLGLAEMSDRPRAVADFARVAKPGGEVRCTIPLLGTFREFYDIYREVLVKHDKHDILDRVSSHVEQTYPTVEDCERWMQAAGLEGEVKIEEFTLLFKSSREFFFAPVIEFGPLATWKALAGTGQEMQDIFWYIKEAIDSYFEGRSFEITVRAGCLVGKKVDAYVEEIEEIDDATIIDEESEAIEIGTEELEIAEVAQTVSKYEVDRVADVPLDAFADGSERPDHLDEE